MKTKDCSFADAHWQRPFVVVVVRVIPVPVAVVGIEVGGAGTVCSSSSSD